MGKFVAEKSSWDEKKKKLISPSVLTKCLFNMITENYRATFQLNINVTSIQI